VKSPAILILVLACLVPVFGESGTEERKKKILEHESRPASAEALARKERSLAFLAEKNVYTLASLPVIEDAAIAKFRAPREIAERLLGCTVAAVAGQTRDRKFVDQLIADWGAAALLTPDERKFVTGPLTDRRECVQYSWHYERAWVLLWALGYVERLDYPTRQCDVGLLKEVLTTRKLEQIVAGAKPRSTAELLDAADLIYRLHWTVVDDRVNDKTRVPAEVEKGAVQEWHHALNWLIGYMAADWDDVTTDT
jgi:hypothetical protein